MLRLIGDINKTVEEFITSALNKWPFGISSQKYSEEFPKTCGRNMHIVFEVSATEWRTVNTLS